MRNPRPRHTITPTERSKADGPSARLQFKSGRAELIRDYDPIVNEQKARKVYKSNIQEFNELYNVDILRAYTGGIQLFFRRDEDNDYFK